MSKACSTTGLNEEHDPERRPDVTDSVSRKLALDRAPQPRHSGKPPTDGTLVAARETSEAPKKTNGGRLAETLDRTLEPRLAPGKAGRPAGAGNYEWTPEMDKLLIEFRTRYDRGGTAPGGWLAKAKNVMANRLMELCPSKSRPRKDSLRSAVERRMVFLGLSTGDLRKKAEPNPAAKRASKEVRSGAWTPVEITALLGSLGSDLFNETIEKRTHHTIEACYAKLRRLGYTVNELRSIALTVDELAKMFQVSPRRVRTWKEKRWLRTTRRRVTDKDLMAFLKEHHGLIAFDALPLKVRTFLLDLGYPAKEASSFHANVKAILESVAGRKRRNDAQTSGTSDSARSEGGPLKKVLDKISRWNQLKLQRIASQHSLWHYTWPSSLAFAAEAAG